jgi:hypothetical protein
MLVMMKRLISTIATTLVFGAMAFAADPEPEETLVIASHRLGTRTGYYVASAHLRDMPLWNPSRENPPLQLSAFITAAFVDVNAKPELASKLWTFDKVEIDELDHFRGRWIYHVTLSAFEPRPIRTGRSYQVSGIGMTTYHHVYFLHDGTPMPGRVIKMK